MTGHPRRGRAAATALSLPSLLLFLAIAFAVFANTWVDPFHRAIGVPGDSYLVDWFLRWTAFAVTHLEDPLVSTYMGYPDGLNLMWNTSMLLPGALLTPITLGLGPVFAYNLLATLALALSAWCATLAIRRWVPGLLPATVGGLLYGFSPYMFAQSVGHPHVTLAVYPPLALLLLGDILVDQRRSAVLWGALLGALTAAQLLTAEELVATTFLAAAVALAWLVVMHRRQVRARWRHAAAALTVALGVTAVLSAVPLGVQFFGPQRVHGEIQAHSFFVTDLLNFVVPTNVQALTTQAALEITGKFTGNGSEADAYLGVPLILLLAATTLIAWRQPVVRLAALAGLTIAILSLGPRLHIAGADTGLRLPYRALDRLPVLGNLLPARLVLYVDLAAAFLLAAFVRRVLVARPWPRAAGLALAAVALVPLFPRLPYYTAPAITPVAFTTSIAPRVEQGQVLLVAPAYGAQSTSPALWQAESGMRFRLTSGYYVGPDAEGRAILGPKASPLSTVLGRIGDGGPAPALDGATRGTLLGELSSNQVRAVVVGPMDRQAETVGFFGDLLQRPPALDGGVYVWWLS